jgi:hypothetical protein
MPFYYAFTRPHTTSGTPLAVTNVFRVTTVASQAPARLVGLYGGAKGTTAGGGMLRVERSTGAASGGSAIAAPNGEAGVGMRRNPDAPTSMTTIFTEATSITSGTTPVTQLSVAFAQTGGQGGWVALDPDHAVTLKSGGAAASGHMVIQSLAAAASIPVEITGEYQEG